MTFKRSQVEDALCRFNTVGVAKRARFLSRLKRLLDIDRTHPSKRGHGQSRYAFFSEERPGTGQESLFAEYEVFALDVAIQLASLGLSQIDVVEILRGLRSKLELEHRNILSKPLDHYIDLKAAEKDREPGVSAHPIFLAVTPANQGRPNTFTTKSGLTAEIIRGGAIWLEHFWDTRGKALTTLEISTIPHGVQSQLMRVKPRKKGRPSS